ncbi:MAG: serine/threonine protein kinase, partial [Planctomycetaceae bacterium]|nr:serine/threonine protein kinase [Planctomycetaceae bacterium]
MSDGQATADRELSTSDTAVPTVGDKTHVLEAPAATIVQGESTRRNHTAAAQTIVAPDNDAASAAAQTIVAPADNDAANGQDYTYGATVVANGEFPGDDANGFQMGATVLPGDDPAARATRVADVLSSFDAAQQAGEFEIAPGESVIGRFRILKTLGEGSFGAVYLAEDPQLDRRVAIKVTKVGVLTTRSDVDRFQREAKAAAQLRHPNIVPVYEVGRIGRSSFLAYEFIDGRTLGNHLKEEKKLPPRDAAQIMFAIAGALGYAHELGIIHRDMKPDNVLLDKQGQPHIADFGLARRDSGEMDKTREGGLMGTPLYMSPEQASGRSHEADARADVWSLGVMLREMLTGVLPFTGKLTEILIGIQTVEPPKIRALDKKLPKDLETICQKCLSKDPAQRYANGTELAAELDRYLRGAPILARPLSPAARLVRWVRRNPAGTLVMAALLCAAIVSTWSVVAFKQEQKNNSLQKLQSLTSIQTALVPKSIDELADAKEVIAAPLRQRLASADLAAPPRNRLRLALAKLFPETAEQELSFDEIADTLVQMPADELQMQVKLLAEGRFHSHAVPKLTEIAHDKARDPTERRPALYALATLDPSLASWETDAADAAAGMLAANRKDLPAILPLIHPIRDRIAIELEQQFDDPQFGDEAAGVLALMFEDQPPKLYSFVRRATPRQLHALIEAMRSSDSNLGAVAQMAQSDIAGIVAGDSIPANELVARCNAFLVLYGVAPQAVDWTLLAGGPDNSLRTEIIQRMPQAVSQWNAVAAQLRTEPDPTVRQALLLALEKYSYIDLEPEDRASLLPMVLELYRSDPSPAVHSAARQFLEIAGGSAALQSEKAPIAADDRGPRDWFRNT